MSTAPLFTLAGILAMICLFGCGAALPHPAEIRENANGMRHELNDVARDIAALTPIIAAGCAYREADESIERACKAIDVAWRAAHTAIEVANDAIDAYDETGIGLAAVHRAVDAVQTAADKVVDAAHALQGFVDSFRDKTVDDSEPGAIEEDGSAPTEG